MVVLGSREIDLEKSEDWLMEIPFKLKNFKIHPEYISGKKYFDVAMVKLDNPVPLHDNNLVGPYVNTICLPEVNTISN